MEQWKKVSGYESLYEVSDHGRIRSVYRTIRDKNGNVRLIKGRILSQYKKSKDYLAVDLSKEGATRQEYVHALVAHHFIGERPVSAYEIAHNDGDPANNKSSNLRYCTPAENAADRKAHGTCRSGPDHHRYRHGRYCQ